MAWLLEKGVPWDVIPLLDEWIITRIIDPPRDENGRLRVRPKGENPPEGFAAFVAKWRGFGMTEAEIRRCWQAGLKA